MKAAIVKAEATKKPVNISEFIYQPHEAAQSVEEYVAYAIKAWEEAYNEGKASGCSEADSHEVANVAFRCVLPIMSSKLAVQSFIACVAVAQARQWITPEEARSLSYTAQLGMSAVKEMRK